MLKTDKYFYFPEISILFHCLMLSAPNPNNMSLMVSLVSVIMGLQFKKNHPFKKSSMS